MTEKKEDFVGGYEKLGDFFPKVEQKGKQKIRDKR